MIEKIPEMEGLLDRSLTEKEKKEIRAKTGKILWLGLMTSPDLLYDVNVLSSQVSNATVSTTMELNRLVAKAKNQKNKVL